MKIYCRPFDAPALTDRDHGVRSDRPSAADETLRHVHDIGVTTAKIGTRKQTDLLGLIFGFNAIFHGNSGGYRYRFSLVRSMRLFVVKCWARFESDYRTLRIDNDSTHNAVGQKLR